MDRIPDMGASFDATALNSSSRRGWTTACLHMLSSYQQYSLNAKTRG